MSTCIDHGKCKSLSPEGYLLVTRPEYFSRGCKTRSIAKHRLVLLTKLGINWWDEEAKDLVARHTCDNPRCINPEHLVAGTRGDNNRDRAERGRSAKKVPSKWKLTPTDCKAIINSYNKKDRENNKSALSARFKVDRKIITQVLEGTYSGLDFNL